MAEGITPSDSNQLWNIYMPFIHKLPSLLEGALAFEEVVTLCDLWLDSLAFHV
jgi:hypothetical protein